MVLIDTHGQQYKLLASYKERDRITPYGGHWDARNGWWVLPSIPEEMLKGFDDLQISEEATERIRKETARRQELLRLHSSGDAQVKYNNDRLDPYQRVGARFLALAGKAILADCPGVGKSAQAITAACEVGAKKILVVTEKSLIYNWEQQFRLWMPPDYEATREITNYEQVAIHLSKFLHKKPDVLIVDESTQVKNRKAKRSQAIYKLAQTVPYVWLLTGSPVLNRPDELWMPLHIVDPQRFRSYWRFVETYCLVEHNPWSGGVKPVGLNPAMSKALSAELATVLLRRSKDVIALPPITRETIFVELAGVQKSMYESMLNEFFVILDNSKIVHAPSVVAQLVRLRQITCSPALVGGPDVSAKTDALLEIVENYAPDYKILIFTLFVPYADLLASKLSKFNAVKITGGVPLKQRNQAKDAFNNDPQCRVLVGTIGAMGKGHNIQAGDIVIHADKAWVPDIVEQAESRAHRRGRTDPVHVISLVASGTIDEHVEAVLENKYRIKREVDAVTMLVKLLQERRG